jgi:hypothetical protein
MRIAEQLVMKLGKKNMGTYSAMMRHVRFYYHSTSIISAVHAF